MGLALWFWFSLHVSSSNKTPKKELYVALTPRLGMETKEHIDIVSHFQWKNEPILKKLNILIFMLCVKHLCFPCRVKYAVTAKLAKCELYWQSVE